MKKHSKETRIETNNPVENNLPNQDRYLTEKQAAELTGYSCAWFSRARWAGDGPPYTKTGNAVRYKLSSLVAWMDSHTITNTGKQQRS